MATTATEPLARLPRLLQLASPALPVGAYAYSEGLETLIASGTVADAAALAHWLQWALAVGSIRLDAAVLARVMGAMEAGDAATVAHWNAWLAATRETAELRAQQAQMGLSLASLGRQLVPESTPWLDACGMEVGFAVAFGVLAACWGLAPRLAVLGYLQAWATNLVTVGVKSIPLGQTAGQQLLLALDARLVATCDEVLGWPEEDWAVCGWGPALASMAHETQYSRLYRS